MRPERAIVDAGPLVALLSQSDAAHVDCASVAQALSPPMLSSWAVLAEAAWLLRNTRDGLTNLMRLVAEGVVACPPLDLSAALWMTARAEQYRDLRPQLADLTLLYLAEREKITTIFTLDRRDFAVYRDSQGNAFQLLP